jgi:hypothetical protein
MSGGGTTINNSAPMISGLRIQTSVYGLPIPIVWGQNRIAANLLWYADFKAIAHTTSHTSGGKGGGGSVTQNQTTYTYQAAGIIGLCEGPIAGIGQVWSAKSNTTMEAMGLTLETGIAAQPIWSYLTTNHPTQAIGYSNTALVYNEVYALDENAQLQNNTFEVKGLLQFGSGITGANPAAILPDAASNVNYGFGFDASKIGSLTNYSNYCVSLGLFLSPALVGQQAAQQFVNDLMTMTNSALVWSEWQLKVIPYGDTASTGNGATFTPNTTPVHDLTDDDFIGDSSADPVTVVRKQQADAFNQVQVEYLSALNQYNPAVAEAKDQSNIDRYGLRPQQPLKYHFITDNATARTVGQLILQRNLHVRNVYTFQLGWKYALLEPMDLVTLTDSGLGLSLYPVRIISIEEDGSEFLTIEAEDYPAGNATASLYPAQIPNGYQSQFNIDSGLTNAPVIFDAPAELTSSGYELWMVASGGVNWGGCNVWVSLDNTTFKQVGTIHGAGRYGVLSAALNSNPTNTDTSSTVSVNLGLSTGVLNSGSAADADNKNTLSVIYESGSVTAEFISFSTATLTSANNYNLTTYFKRGLYGSPNVAHPINSPFVRIDDAVFKYAYDPSLVGKQIYVKLVPFNSYGNSNYGLADVTSTSVLIGGSTSIPSDVTGFAATTQNDGILLTWNQAPDHAIKYYEIRQGASWAAGTLISQSNATQLKLIPATAGSYTYWIKILDKANTYSSNAATAVSTPVVPSAPAVTGGVVGPQYSLSWTVPAYGFQIDHYEIRYGSSWAAGTFVTQTKSTQIQQPATWGGARQFWVSAVDIAGNVGAAGSSTISTVAPSAPFVTSQVVDNNVLLYWTDATQTLPIKFYELRRGATYATSSLIGTKQGLFTTVFETTKGTYTYWVTGVDSAGVYGTPAPLTTAVNQPPDYVLKVDLDSTFSGTLVNAKLDQAGFLVLPINLTETYAQHFTSHTWTNPADQIAAGYPVYIQPALSPGYYEETIDYGQILAASKITLAVTGSVVAGAPTLTPMLSVKKLVGDAWTDYSGVSTIYATNFQFVKFRFTVSGGLADLYQVNGFNIRIDSKLISDAGNCNAAAPATVTISNGVGSVVTWIGHNRTEGQTIVFTTTGALPAPLVAGTVYYVRNPVANSFNLASVVGGAIITTTTAGSGVHTADEFGTVVNFAQPFIDVSSITVSANSTIPLTAIYDFLDVPDPTFFKVLVLRSDTGTRVSNLASWSAKGY